MVMRTTVTLDNDVYDAVMHISVISGERPGRVLSRLVRKALAPEPRESSKPARFPIFEVSANAPVISGQHAQQLIDEQGI
jgi:hypothetical protein